MDARREFISFEPPFGGIEATDRSVRRKQRHIPAHPIRARDGGDRHALPGTGTRRYDAVGEVEIDAEAVEHPVSDAAAAEVAAKINRCRPAVDKASFRPHHAVDTRASRDRLDEHVLLNALNSKISQNT